jgi:hypothetical protein
MTATLALPAKEVRSGDVLATTTRPRVKAIIPKNGLYLLLCEDGTGPMLPADSLVPVECTEVPGV